MQKQGFKKVSAKVFGEEFNDVEIAARDVSGDGEAQEWIPDIDPNYHFRRDHLSVITHFLTRAWESGPKEGLHIIGPTGSGKTSLIEQVCARLDTPLVSITCHDRLEVPDLICTIEALNGSTIPVDGPLVKAMRHGMVFVLHEIDTVESGTLTGLNDILERGKVVIPSTGELVRAAPGFAFVVTSNTGGAGDEVGLYVGTKVQNLAFRDRFTSIKVGYMTKDEETAALMKSGNYDVDQLRPFLEVANMVREAFMKGTGMSVTMSTRTLQRWVRLAGEFQGLAARGIAPIHFAMDLALANNVSEAESISLHQMVEQVSGVPAVLPKGNQP